MSAILRVEDLNVWLPWAVAPRARAVANSRIPWTYVVRGVSFEVREGERFGLIGESGCGKSTTMLALMGLLPAGARITGQIWLGDRQLIGKDDLSLDHRWTDVSMVFQGSMNSFSPVTRIGKQLTEPMRVHQGLSRRAAQARAKDLLGRVRLKTDAFDCFPHELSGGMRQRAALAMALACAPQVLIADEPTTALDVIIQSEILELINELAEELHLSVLMVSHDLGAVEQVCHRAAVMYAGAFVEVGPLIRLREHPSHPYTRMLFDANPDLRYWRSLSSIPGNPPRLDQEFEGCPFAPRCDLVEEACWSWKPHLLDTWPGCRAACRVVVPETSAVA